MFIVSIPLHHGNDSYAGMTQPSFSVVYAEPIVRTYSIMSSRCKGKLCSAAAADGKERGQGHKKYNGLCAACFHHQHGTSMQFHRRGGVDGCCKNHPACQRWKVNGCGGFCVRCCRAAGGEPPIRKKRSLAVDTTLSHSKAFAEGVY